MSFFIYFSSSSPTKYCSPLVCTSAAPLPAISMDHNSLLSHSSSSAEAVIAAPLGPHASHVSLFAHHSNSLSSHSHKTTVFASIGGLIGLIFLALCVRRLIIHSRIPRQNTVLTDAERARIVREIAECESASRRYWQCHSRTGSATGPPPPPYEHAPPYDLLAQR